MMKIPRKLKKRIKNMSHDEYEDMTTDIKYWYYIQGTESKYAKFLINRILDKDKKNKKILPLGLYDNIADGSLKGWGILYMLRNKDYRESLKYEVEQKRLVIDNEVSNLLSMPFQEAFEYLEVLKFKLK